MNSQYPYTPQNEQPPYYNQSFANPPSEKNPARGMAIAALITAIASTVLSCCTCGLSIIGLIVAIVLAIVAKKRAGGKMPGQALAALIISIVALALLRLIFGLIFLTEGLAYLEDPQAYMDNLFQDTYGMTYEEFMEDAEGAVTELPE